MTIKGVLLSNKEGRLIFYRNYSDISHSLFEDFAFSLPQKIKIEAQHTFSLHGNYRLNYLPIEDTLLLVLVVSLDSNIIDDMESVGKMKEVVYSILGQDVKEQNVYDNFIDLAFAFDDMINLQMRNVISKNQVMALLEMDSANEKMHNAIMKNREKEAQKKTEEEFRKIEKTRRAQDIIGKELQTIDASIKSYTGVNDFKEVISPDMQIKNNNFAFGDEKKEKVSSVAKIEGISLGKPKTKKTSGLTDLFEKPARKEKIQETPKTIEEEEKVYNVLAEDMLLSLEEKLNGHINADGEFTKLELKGVLYLYINNPNLNYFQIQTNCNQIKSIPMKIPPSFDKKLWSKGILVLKEKIAPLQPNIYIETVKYGINFSNLEEVVPFNFSFWFSGQEFSAEIKFNENQQLFEAVDNIELQFSKITADTKFNVQDIEDSSWELISNQFVWKIPTLNAETSSASLILNFPNEMDESTLLPAEVKLDSPHIVSNLQIQNVKKQDSDDAKYEFRKRLIAKDLTIS